MLPVTGYLLFCNLFLHYNYKGFLLLLFHFSQTCVRDRAVRSILAVRKVSKETAEKAVDEVFDTCFNDQEPFGRIPHNKKDAKYAHKDFQNRDQYYANI